MRFPHVFANGVIHGVTATFHALRVHNRRQRNDRDFRRAAADIDNHAARRIADRQLHADRARQRLWNKAHFARPRLFRTVLHGTHFHFVDSVWHSYDNARLHHFVVATALVDEIAQHFIRNFRVRNDTVLHRTNRQNIARITTEHVLRTLSYCDDFVRVLVQGDDRRFFHDNPTTCDVHQRVHRPKINADVIRKNCH